MDAMEILHMEEVSGGLSYNERLKLEIAVLLEEENAIPATFRRPGRHTACDVAVGPDGEPTVVRKPKNPSQRFQ